MKPCYECPTCKGWGQIRTRTGRIIDCGGCLGSGCAVHKAPPGEPVGANCVRARAAQETERC